MFEIYQYKIEHIYEPNKMLKKSPEGLLAS